MPHGVEKRGSKYAAFLRGINLGSQRRISGAELRSTFEGMGFEEVSTFRASGNVVFSAADGSAAKLADRIEAELAKAAGFDVAVFLRGAREVRAIAAERPFEKKLLEGSRGKLQVALLARKPAAGRRKEVLSEGTDEDRLAFAARELYWLPSDGTRDSGLNLKVIEKLVGPWTMRTKGTIDELAAKHFAD